MMKYIIVLILVAGASALKVGTETGTTPPPCFVSNADCSGKSDGNYEYFDPSNNPNNRPINVHYFLQCSNGNAYCQPCWPLSLEFSPLCNQCMYNKTDVCYTTASWFVVPTYTCPDLCSDPALGPSFSGNLEDPSEKRHYVGCWEGILMGCVNCPFQLQFNQTWNACLYEGRFLTRP